MWPTNLTKKVALASYVQFSMGDVVLKTEPGKIFYTKDISRKETGGRIIADKCPPTRRASSNQTFCPPSPPIREFALQMSSNWTFWPNKIYKLVQPLYLV